MHSADPYRVQRACNDSVPAKCLISFAVSPKITIPDKSKKCEKAAIRPIDERLLATPSVAVEVCARSVAEMNGDGKTDGSSYAIALTKKTIRLSFATA